MSRLWAVVLVVVLLFVLVAFGMMEMHLIGEATTAQEQRVLAELNAAASRLNRDISRELMHLAASFDMTSADPAELSLRYDRWAATARDPRLVAGVFVLMDGEARRLDLKRRTLVPSAAPPLPPPRRHERMGGFDPDVPAMMLPLPPGALLIALDRAYLFQTFMPSLLRTYFHGYDAAIVRDDEVVYRSNPQWPHSVADAQPDFAAPLMPRPERPARWQIIVQHRGRTLATIFQHQRLHATLITFGIVAILASSVVVFAFAARRADRMRRQQLEFVAGVTHELHTPLAALATAGQNLADGVNVDTAKYGRAIVTEAKRLTDLVDGVLEFSGMEARPAAHASDPVDIARVVGDAVSQCSSLAADRGITIETAAAEPLPATRGDQAALTRAVQNLVANAIRHGAEGRWVGVRASAENGHVLITVADRGSGIAASDLPHVFEPFYRGRNAQTRGSGLGLAIVHRVVRAHGGSVKAANRRDRGAEFQVRLPVA